MAGNRVNNPGFELPLADGWLTDAWFRNAGEGQYEGAWRAVGITAPEAGAGWNQLWTIPIAVTSGRRYTWSFAYLHAFGVGLLYLDVDTSNSGFWVEQEYILRLVEFEGSGWLTHPKRSRHGMASKRGKRIISVTEVECIESGNRCPLS